MTSVLLSSPCGLCRGTGQRPLAMLPILGDSGETPWPIGGPVPCINCEATGWLALRARFSALPANDQPPPYTCR